MFEVNAEKQWNDSFHTFWQLGWKGFLYKLIWVYKPFMIERMISRYFFVNTSKMFHRILPLTRTCEQSKIFVNTSAK